MNKALVIGGSSGIGLAVALELSKICKEVIIVDKKEPIKMNIRPSNYKFKRIDLTLNQYDWLEEYGDVDTLFYSAGVGRVVEFGKLHSKEIDNIFQINTISCFKILHHFINNLKDKKPFYCGVMVSISARISSPLYSIYSASKAALFRGIEAINTELIDEGTRNRILEISPGSFPGTSFNGPDTILEDLTTLAGQIIYQMQKHSTLLIPQYEETFKRVLQEYSLDPLEFSLNSLRYKRQNNMVQSKPGLKIGYLSGTFDLFHIGHLNILKRARENCDYLVVGVHKDASHKGKTTFISFEERVEILKNIKYVDQVVESEREDSDIYKKDIVKYDKLFVGSDYKNTSRFNNYERYFKDKGVEIVYFPYTKGTSSTQLREALKKHNN